MHKVFGRVLLFSVFFLFFCVFLHKAEMFEPVLTWTLTQAPYGGVLIIRGEIVFSQNTLNWFVCKMIVLGKTLNKVGYWSLSHSFSQTHTHTRQGGRVHDVTTNYCLQ